MTVASTLLQDDMTPADRIASTTIDLFSKLPTRGKPQVRPNGVHEWTVLASICLLVRPADIERCTTCYPKQADGTRKRVLPISLGTGVKVLPATRLPPLGDTLHDSHAEVLARRGFVRWLMEEASKLIKGDKHEDILEWQEGLFKLRDGVEVWLYVSTLPCGDASTLYTALHQPSEMAALKSSQLGFVPPSFPGSAVRGRNGYENYGAIRTKPGRSDSIPAISFSCSDKIASWNVLGLQGALLEGLFEPVYLDGVVIGGVEGTEGMRERMQQELQRALYGRMASLTARLPPPYRLNCPRIFFTSLDFPFSKASVSLIAPSEPTSCPLGISFVPLVSPQPELLINGSKQGGKWKEGATAPLKEASRSSLCKLEMVRLYGRLRTAIIDKGHDTEAPSLCENNTYYDLKHQAGSRYQQCKKLLRGNAGAPVPLPQFEQCGQFATSGEDVDGEEPPFKGWIVSGQRWESFTLDGARKVGVEVEE